MKFFDIFSILSVIKLGDNLTVFCRCGYTASVEGVRSLCTQPSQTCSKQRRCGHELTRMLPLTEIGLWYAPTTVNVARAKALLPDDGLRFTGRKILDSDISSLGRMLSIPLLP
ncbi:hypothetical protein I7I48_05395 [Histoplasma ohiense]|nr:hypothetical protein I7I48_05395 [Histoplasma ohiense (nom. inval.)]